MTKNRNKTIKNYKNEITNDIEAVQKATISFQNTLNQ
jgi:hypothetical protein